MNDVVAIQQALYHGLRSCSLFNTMNVVLGRQFLVQSEIDMAAIWLTPRGGCQGIGAMVQIPTLRFPKPNSLQRLRVFSIGIYEERNMNWTPDVGTMRFAEDWADTMIDFLWNWRLWRTSGLILEDNAVIPDSRFESIGIVGVAAQVTVRQERAQPDRAATPSITVDGANNVTIAVTDGSQIFYTRDGFSFPGPDNDGSQENEQAAVLYAAPFAAVSGNIIQAMAYTDGKLPSQLASFQIP